MTRSEDCRLVRCWLSYPHRKCSDSKVNGPTGPSWPTRFLVWQMYDVDQGPTPRLLIALTWCPGWIKNDRWSEAGAHGDGVRG